VIWIGRESIGKKTSCTSCANDYGVKDHVDE